MEAKTKATRPKADLEALAHISRKLDDDRRYDAAQEVADAIAEINALRHELQEEHVAPAPEQQGLSETQWQQVNNIILGLGFEFDGSRLRLVHHTHDGKENSTTSIECADILAAAVRR